MPEDKIIKNKKSAINKLDTLLDNIYKADPSKTDKLSYWIREYANYLDYEKTFQPDKLLRYKRGDIIKVNLGFRLGSELGGLHYCVVLDNFNSIKSPLLTVMPLSSLKEKTNIHNLPKDRIYLGDELFDKLDAKINVTFKEWQSIIDKAQAALDKGKINIAEWIELDKKHKKFKKTAGKILTEVKKMKHGSVALAGQIITISKMRIYDPINTASVLHGIRLSGESLDLINKKIQELYIHNNS